MSNEYDYIIVGSGAGGSTLAYRLAQARAGSILVLEHGLDDDDPMHQVPKGFFHTLNGDRYAYRYATAAVAATGQGELWTRGDVVGGSTTINGMQYSRGAAPDFAALAEHTTADHWGWDRVLSAYRAMEDHELGGSSMRGGDGPLGISADGPHDELADRIFAAADGMGWPRVADLNENHSERIGYTPSTVRHGRRTSAASAFLRPVRRDGTVTLITGTRVTRIVIDGDRAKGVSAMRAGATVEFRARREIILAGGTIESPLLLERSGIGRPDVLARIGADVVVGSPNVGERLIEHRIVAAQMRFDRGLGSTAELRRFLAQGAFLEQSTERLPELAATGGYDFMFQCKSDPSLDRPDLVGSIAPYAMDPAAGSLHELADHAGMAIGIWPLRPETSGSVHASGLDPAAPPVISPRYLEAPADAAAASRALPIIRAFAAAGPLAEVVAGEDFPTAAVPDDPDSALDYARRFGVAASHAVGSCAMGPDDDDVVDPYLRVRGIHGLRVVDASVLPFQVSANTAAPVMAVAWIAGDLIAGS